MTNKIESLIQALRTASDVLRSDAGPLMREAIANDIARLLREAAQPAEQKPPFQLPDFATDPDDSDEVASLWDHGFKRGWNSCLEAVAKTMQHAEQQPTPDVSALVEALELARDTLDDVRGDINPERGYADELEEDVSVAYNAALSALAAYSQRGWMP